MARIFTSNFLRACRTYQPLLPHEKISLKETGLLRRTFRPRGCKGGKYRIRQIETVKSVGRNRLEKLPNDFLPHERVLIDVFANQQNQLRTIMKPSVSERNWERPMFKRRRVLRSVSVVRNSQRNSSYEKERAIPSLMLTNVRSLRNKKHELEATIESYLSQIVCVTETWATPDIPDHVLSMSGFKLFRRDRPHQKGGGIAVYLPVDTYARRMYDLEDSDLEVIWLQLRPQWLPRTIPVIMLGLIYHPPCKNNKQGVDEMLTYLVTTVDSIHSHQPQAGILLCGDLNGLPLRRLQAAHPTLRQIVKQPTRGTAILDVVITNLAQHYCTPRVIPPVGTSDHSCVVLQPVQSMQMQRKNTVKCRRRVVTNVRRVDFALALARTEWTAVTDALSVEEKVSTFYSIITALVERHFPVRVKTVPKNNKTWMTDRVKRAIIKRQAEFLRHGKSTTWRRLRNRAKTVVRQAKNWHYRNCIQQLRQENPSKWWACINKELGRTCERSVPIATGGPSAVEVAESTNTHFSKSWCQGQPLSLFPLPRGAIGHDLCSIGEVKTLLKSINPRKASGPDDLPSWILKEHAEDLAPIITHLFNESYEYGTVPLIWKSANVAPVPKSAEATEVCDMRPISLLPVLAKMMERCILKRLMPSLRAVIKDQYAYMRGSSTTIALVRMVQTWLTALDSKKPTLIRALFADMSKAFDRVDHAILLQHVIDIQASPRMVTWIHSYLSGRRQRVLMNNVTSAWKEPTSGVPQGGVLSPYLFLLFMCSRTTVHPETMNVGYADDVSMSRTILVRQVDEDNTLQEESSNLDSWASSNNMLLNGKKSQLLQICPCRSAPNPPRLTLGGVCVPWVNSAKCLGFILDKSLTLQEQVNSMVTKASRRLYYLRLLSKQGTSVADLILIYLALIRPVLEYGHVLLVSCSKEQERAMEQVQRRALRIISRAGRRSVPHLPTLKSRREEAAVKLFKQMLQKDHPLHDLVPPSRSTATGRTLRNQHGISIPPARTKRLQNSFLHQSIRLYNLTIKQQL